MIKEAKCQECKDTGFFRCACALDGFNEGGCNECYQDSGYELCEDCDAALDLVINPQRNKIIADLQAENKRLLEAIGDAYKSFSHIHGLQDGLQILANASKKEGE